MPSARVRPSAWGPTLALGVWMVVAGLASASAWGEPTASQATAATDRPNVVVVFVDDLGWKDLSCQGSSFYDTPHIDGLARDGVRFLNGYAACAVCSPSRAAYMTGRSPMRTGVTDWIRNRSPEKSDTPRDAPTDWVGGRRAKLLCPPNPFWLDREETTLAEVLSQAGYTTAHLGKWHLGDPGYYPPEQGYDINIGGCDYGQPPTYYDPFAARQRSAPPNLPSRKVGEYLSDREADEAVGFIRDHADGPFFLSYCPYAVHTPIEPKKDLLEKYEARAKTYQQETGETLDRRRIEYATMVESVDLAVGAIRAELARLGLTERTLMVFTSDNGGLLPMTDNRPLRAGKGYAYEGGLRVPLIAAWPGRIVAGRTIAAPATTVDLFPTICAATTTPVPTDRPLDGLNLLPQMTDRSASSWESASDRPDGSAARDLFWHFPHYRQNDVTPYSIIRQGKWKLIHYYEGPTVELYDLEADPSEATDLASDQPDVVDRLRSALEVHLTDTGAKIPRPNPAYRDR